MIDNKKTLPTLKCAIAAAAWLTTVLDKYQPDFSVSDEKLRFAIALLKICREHRDATTVLIHFGGRTSAPVVARSAFEAYVLALWVTEFGDVAILKNLLNGTDNAHLPPMKRLVHMLRKAKHPLSPFIADVQPIYSALSDYAHGYGRQVSRWLLSENITSSHSDAEMMEVLLLTDAIAVLAAITFQRIAGGDVDKGARILHLVLSREYFDVNTREI